MITKTDQALKEVLDPYLFYWNEWTQNANCNLNGVEINKVNQFILENFSTGPVHETEYNFETEQLKTIVRKLVSGYQVFRAFVVVDFFNVLNEIAKNDPISYQGFLHTPITDLKLPEPIKETLLPFKVYTLSHLVTIYDSSEFNQGMLYNHIVQFQITKKKCKLSINLKPISMENDRYN